MAAFRALPEHAVLAREYAGFLREEGTSTYGPTWESYGGSDSTTVQRLRARDGRELVVVSAYAELGCGGFDGSLCALFERGPSGLVVMDVGTWADTPIFVVELADRAAPVFVRFEAFRGGDEVEEGRRIWHDASAPWVGCPC